MKNKILLSFVLFLIAENCLAQFDSKINFDSLVQKSDAFVLEDLTEIEIYDEQSAEYTIKEKILVKNNKGDKYCRKILKESHFIEVEDISARMVSLEGEIIKELDSDEIEEAEFSVGEFYSGSNHKFFEFKPTQYPFVFEVEYKTKINSLLFWPSWEPQYKIPNEKSVYKISINPDIKFKYYSKGIDCNPTKMGSSSYDIYTWELKNIPPVVEEDFLPPEDNVQMMLYFEPEIFYTDSYKGSTENWNEFARWYRNLADGRYSLPENAKKEIQDLIKDKTSTKEKIKTLYKHMQKKSRYVDIEIGLSGWQPQSAEQVFANGYGDCKDLSTFMIAMLDAAGIKSYPALALTRSGGVVNTDFPSSHFNHCIVCVPLEKDTLWLECTSTYDDMGELDYNIEDIYTLVIDTSNGTINKTPQKKSYQNKWISTIDASLNSLMDLKINSTITATGNQKNYLNDNLARMNSKDDIQFLTDLLSENYSNLNIDMYNLCDQNIEGKDYTITLNGIYKKFLPSEATRLFVNPSLFNRQTAEDLPKEEINKRKYPVYFTYPYLDADTVYITFPKYYSLEAKPSDQSIENDIISYKTKYDLTDRKLFFVRTFELKKNYITLNEYPLFYDTMKKIIELDKSKFVLKKN
jgi:transglutaminase-like putative cysteine protease